MEKQLVSTLSEATLSRVPRLVREVVTGDLLDTSVILRHGSGNDRLHSADDPCTTGRSCYKVRMDLRELLDLPEGRTLCQTCMAPRRGPLGAATMIGLLQQANAHLGSVDPAEEDQLLLVRLKALLGDASARLQHDVPEEYAGMAGQAVKESLLSAARLEEFWDTAGQEAVLRAAQAVGGGSDEVFLCVPDVRFGEWPGRRHPLLEPAMRAFRVQTRSDGTTLLALPSAVLQSLVHDHSVDVGGEADGESEETLDTALSLYGTDTWYEDLANCLAAARVV